MSPPSDTPRSPHGWRRWIVLSSPVVLIALAALGLFADLRVEDATGGVGAPLTMPLPFGVYVSPASEKELDALLGGTASAAAPAWQLEVEANYQGTDGIDLPGTDVPGTAQAQFSFGPLRSGLLGNTAIGDSAASLGGSLPKPVDIVFILPASLLSGTSEQCATWDVGGAEHHATGTVLQAGGGWPDILVCHIPAIPAFTALQITAYDVMPVPSLKPSWVGSSAITVVNPRILELIAPQDDGVIPNNLVGALGEQYDLYLQPPKGSSFTDIEPGPTGIGLRTRQITMDPGDSMDASMVDSRRHNLVDILQQALLLVSGTLFGLVPAVLPFAARARRGPREGAEATP